VTGAIIAVRRQRLLAALGALAILCAAPQAASADIGNAGTTAAAFLALPPGAAAPGMAGATLALSGDLSAAAANPASLGSIPALEIAFAHAELPDGSRNEWAAIGGILGPLATRWSLSGIYAGQGSFEGRDALNQPTGTFTVSSMAGGAALAQPLGPFLSLGAGVKFVGENLGPVSGTGLAFDAGLTVRAGALGLGASARNFGGGMDYGGQRYGLPVAYGAGVSLERAALRLEVDANMPVDYYNDVRAGIEYRWRDRVALRAGYQLELGADPSTEPLDGPSFGLGAGLRNVWLDYAYLPAVVGQTEQRFGVVLRPFAGGWRGGELGVRRAPSRAAH
jgi:hypothetical protein